MVGILVLITISQTKYFVHILVKFTFSKNFPKMTQCKTPTRHKESILRLRGACYFRTHAHMNPGTVTLCSHAWKVRKISHVTAIAHLVEPSHLLRHFYSHKPRSHWKRLLNHSVPKPMKRCCKPHLSISQNLTESINA